MNLSFIPSISFKQILKKYAKNYLKYICAKPTAVLQVSQTSVGADGAPHVFLIQNSMALSPHWCAFSILSHQYEGPH